MNLSKEVEGVLHRAFAGAREAWHPILTPEHIALELIVEEETAAYLERCGTDLVAVESRLREYLGRIEGSTPEAETTPTSAVQRILGNAAEHVEAEGREYVMAGDLFLALIGERGIASTAIVDATQEPQLLQELRGHAQERTD